jgi:integrase
VDVGEWLFSNQQRGFQEMDDPEDDRPAVWTWAEFRKRYEAEVVPGLAARTADKIGTALNAVEAALPHVAKGNLTDLDAESLSRLQAKLRDGKRSENTIAGYLAHLRAALAWAHDQDKLPTVPKIKRPQRAKRGGAKTKSKGRPLTPEEFQRMVARIPEALQESRRRKRELDRQTRRKKGLKLREVPEPAPAEIPPETVASWKHYLTGLWLSGLRLAESMEVYWNDGHHGLLVDLSGKRPMLKIPAECEKGHRDRTLPITPDFAEFLLQTPNDARQGPVFRPLMLSGNRATAIQAGRIVALMGELAEVVVHINRRTKKYASAHDLRRSFGNRWAKRLPTASLQKLMRHESIATTMRYYVDLDAYELAEDLYRAHSQATASAADNSSAGVWQG